MTKAYVVLYHDKWEHCECEPECCDAITTEVKGVCMTPELAEGLIAQIMQRCGKDREEFEIQIEEVLEH